MVERGKTGGFPIAGLVLMVLVALFLLADGAFQFFGWFIAPEAVGKMMEQGGLPANLAPFTGAALLVSVGLYIYPRSAILGAILITGYLGGAVATDLRVNGPASPGLIISIILGIMTWGGPYLRDAKLRLLLPFRQD